MDEFVRCEEEVSNLETVKRVKDNLLNDEEIFDLAELFKVFGDSTRMKIINALMMEELCVCDIAEITNSTPSAISHQLRVLKQAKLVKYRKEGKSVFYSLDDDHVREIFEKGREHIEEV
ncbi:MAG: helix-turn-helix transcriptional regulator [Clostridia bacterium]|nr:helix-turn-helix transcriptional regulator [Clostridia bacterium]